MESTKRERTYYAVRMRHGYLQLGQTGERIPRNLSVKLVKVSFRDVLTSDFFLSLEDSSTDKVTV